VNRRSLTSVTFSFVLTAISIVAGTCDVSLVQQSYPYLSTGSLSSAKLVDLPTGVVLRSGEMKITQKDLDAEIGKAPSDVRSQLKRNLFFVLENKAMQMFVQYEASEWAKGKKLSGSQEDPVESYLASLAQGLSVTDDESKAFFDSSKDVMGNATFDQVKDQIKEHILNQKRQDAVKAHIATISDRYEIDLNKAWVAKQYSAAMANPIDKARQSGKPTMVDLGADGCRPCEMMTPILEELKKQYEGKVNILFVHVRKEQILAARYGVQSIPVQIFFDKAGKEVFRHVGFFPKDKIVSKLAEMGVQ